MSTHVMRFLLLAKIKRCMKVDEARIIVDRIKNGRQLYYESYQGGSRTSIGYAASTGQFNLSVQDTSDYMNVPPPDESVHDEAGIIAWLMENYTYRDALNDTGGA